MRPLQWLLGVQTGFEGVYSRPRPPLETPFKMVFWGQVDDPLAVFRV
jgi:hypothetical protein